ncbi:MAG: hypothetical protein AAB074_01405 [Planctomycetota bacterium]
MRSTLRLFTALAVAAFFASGCGERDAPRVYRAPKEAPAPAPADPGTSLEAPRWVVPAGWKQLPDQQMRFATFQVDPNDPKLIVTVYSFGPESGALLPNVNRWEQQIGAPVSAEADLPKVVKKLKSNGLEIDAIDLLGVAPEGQAEKQRMLAAIMPVGSKVWFLKFVGAESKVAAHQADYEAFLRSISFAPSGE